MNAANEFKKNPELREDDVKHIREWLNKQIHLPQNITDEVIILLLHSCYYSLELTKQTIDYYFTLRTHIPEFFTERDISKEPGLQEAKETVYVIPFEKRTKEGYQVILGGLKRTEPQYYNFQETFKFFNMVGDAWIHKHETVPGVIIVINFRGMKLSHLPKLTLPTMKKILVYLQDGMPVRLKGLHFINVVPFIDKILLLMKPFMKKELMDMLVLHSEGTTTIYDVVPKDAFPNELGGSAGTIDELRGKVDKLLESCHGWFKEDEKLRVDETKRPGKAKTPGELFGIDGSFRKLTID